MLSNTIMGWLALAILWVNTLLVAAAALKQLGALWARLRALRPLRRVTVVSGDGRSGAIAGHRIDQIGRAGARSAGAETILFSDQRYGGEIYGGAVAGEARSGEAREIAIAPAIDAEVWISRAAARAAAACPSVARFDDAYPHARKAKGYSRTTEAMIRAGDTAWIAGGDEDRDDGAPLAPSLIAGLDPRAFCRSRMALLAAFVLAVVAAAAGCTALALTPPVFGTVSKIGAALGLAFFLLVQPAGTAVRDAVRVPSQAIVRGRWARREI